MSKPDPEKLSCLFDEFERQDTNDVGLEAELEHKTYRWRDVYVERGELGLLMERWKKVSDFQRVEEIQPQLTILLANSGFGKTRLVHKFYEEIVKRHQTDGCRYWPPSSAGTMTRLRLIRHSTKWIWNNGCLFFGGVSSCLIKPPKSRPASRC